MTRTRIDVRLPPELLAHVDAAAERLGQTRTKFIERALEDVLGTRSTLKVLDNGFYEFEDPPALFSEARKEVGKVHVQKASAMVHRFKCRACDFSAPSGKARCPNHGGALRPIV